jgi:hypothetical protein
LTGALLVAATVWGVHAHGRHLDGQHPHGRQR